MSLIKSIDDVGATLAWCPRKGLDACYVALGTTEASGSGFDDYGASLQLHALDLCDGSLSSKPAGVAKTSSRFVSLAWSGMKGGAGGADGLQLGLVAGGMSDGAVDVWDPAKLLAGHPQAHVSRVQRHTGAVNGLEFNPHPTSAHLVASGGADCEVFVASLERPEAPSVFVPAPPPNAAKHAAEVTRVAWNSQVSHILATASQNGSTIVWDLRQKKPWCELRDASFRSPVSAVAWNPAEGLHLATASGDDANPVIKLWDLRSSTTMPLGTLKGHTQGILSLSWCPDDTALLASCGRDNRTLLWDVFTTQCVHELEGGADPQAAAQPAGFGAAAPAFGDATSAFGGGPPGGGGFGGAAAGRRYQCSWCPTRPAVLGTCSFDRTVQVHAMGGAATTSGKAPKWLKRSCGAAFGFGGKIAMFGAKKAPTTATIATLVEDDGLVAASRTFEAALGASDFKDFCENKVKAAASDGDKRVWTFMQLIFEPNAREKLLECLGYDAAAVAATLPPPPQPDAPAAPPPSPPKDETSAEDVFAAASAAPPAAEEPDDAETVVDPGAPLDAAAEADVKQALLVGNFDAAVESCFATGALADALLLASCGGAELWERTRARYFDISSKAKPFLGVVRAIITNELGALVAASDLRKWEETLAILSTYGKSDEFPALCEALGGRLEHEARDDKAAALCYMCAVNVPKTVKFWIDDFNAASRSLGKVDTLALQDLVEKVTIFARDESGACDPAAQLGALGPEVVGLFTNYAALLASQGEALVAAKYCASRDDDSSLLLDRLHRSAGPAYDGHPPAFAVAAVQPSSVITGVAPPQPQSAFAAQQQPAFAAQPQPGFAAQQPAQQPFAQPAAAAPAANGAALPHPWTAIQDPSSGRTYYANTATGATQWDPPAAPAPAPKPKPKPAPAPVPMPARTQPVASAPVAAAPAARAPQPQPAPVPMPNVPQPRAPQPAAVPQPAQFAQPQQPAQFAQRQPAPQPAAAPAPPPAPAPAPKPQPVAQSPEAVAIAENLTAVVAHLGSLPLNGSEKRQLAEVDKSVSKLKEKMTYGALDGDVVGSVHTLVGSMLARDYATASNVQVALVNSHWGEHKDWLKGLKFLIQLAQKKM